MLSLFTTPTLGFEQVSYVDPNRKIASSLGTNGTEMKDIGVEMTFAGGANDGESNGVLVSKAGDNLLSIASKTDPRSSSANEGYKILLEQAVYEMNRGSHAVALEYLNRAVQVQHQFNLKISNTVDGKMFTHYLF